eukprot:TRINITY_DN20044_c4_g1_i1.p1 TRINITY_DN20044_c4_g1~~TRINITY_DN20044_c4_g1_i1.p1  ORF type:complete len:1353 (-),score=98.86 TRINITY_DN20044_c4_g1_i1:163-4221(-)
MKTPGARRYVTFSGCFVMVAGWRQFYSSNDAILAVNTDTGQLLCALSSFARAGWVRPCGELNVSGLAHVYAAKHGFLLTYGRSATALPSFYNLQLHKLVKLSEYFTSDASQWRMVSSNGVWAAIDTDTGDVACFGDSDPDCSQFRVPRGALVFPTAYSPEFVAIDGDNASCYDSAKIWKEYLHWYHSGYDYNNVDYYDYFDLGSRVLDDYLYNTSCEQLNFAGITDVASTEHASVAFSRKTGKGFCWGRQHKGGNCSSVDFSGVTDVVASGAAFVALRKSTGTATCWGQQDTGGNCSSLSFAGVTHIYSTREAFLALNKNNDTGFCWGQWNTGGDCAGVNFKGKTEFYSSAGAFLAFNRNAGLGVCWGDRMLGGHCSRVNFSGVTDIVASGAGFLAFRRHVGSVTCWGSMDCKGDYSFMMCPPGHEEVAGQECVPCAPGKHYSNYHGACSPCEAGFIAPEPGSAACQICGRGTYARGQECADCPAGRYSATKGAADVSACVLCPANTYSETPGETDVRSCKTCPGIRGVAVTKQDGASQLSHCVCAAGYFLPSPAKKFYSLGCVRCDPSMLDCPGNGTSAIAKPGYYIHGEWSKGAIVFPCLVGGGATCLGGLAFNEAGEVAPCSGDYTSCPDQCSAGHRGYACASCDVGYARQRYPEKCEECANINHGFTAIGAGYVFLSVQSLVLAVMQATAARQGGSAIHSIMIRCLTSWSLTVGLLAKIDLTQIRLFEWSDTIAEEQTQDATADSRRPAAESKLEFPPAMSTLLRSLWTFTRKLTELSEVFPLEQAVACWAHDRSLDPQVALAVYWSFLHVPLNLLVAVGVACCMYLGARMVSPDNKNCEDARAAPARLVLGLYKRNSTPLQVVRQTSPVLLFTLYSVWPAVTQSNLFLSSCGRFAGRHGLEYRLLSNLDLICWTDRHWDLIVISYIGVLMWTIAPLVYLYLRIRSFKLRRQTPKVLAQLGYFYTGFKFRFWWWDIFVKRADVLMFMTISSTPTMPDDRARLLWYTFASATFWAVHERYRAFDGRQGGVLNGLESLALSSRFSSVLFICVVLLSEAKPWQCIVLGILVFIANALFLGFSFMHITVEAARSTKATLAKAHHSTLERKTKKLNGLKEATSMSAVLTKLYMAGIWVCSLFAELKEHELRRVPKLVWKHGGGVSLQGHVCNVHAGGGERSFADFVLWRALRRFFRLTPEDQLLGLLGNFANFTEYMTIAALKMPARASPVSRHSSMARRQVQGIYCVPTRSDVFVIMAIAYRDVRLDRPVCTVAELWSAALEVIKDLAENERGSLELSMDDLATVLDVLWMLREDEEDDPLDMIRDLQQALTSSDPKVVATVNDGDKELASI